MKTKRIYSKATAVVILMLFFIVSSCKDFVQVPAPVSQLSSELVYQDDATAKAAMYGVYIQMMTSSSYFASGGSGSVAVLAGLSADELESKATSSSGASFYANALDRYNSDNLRLWQQAYKTIYYANTVLQGLENSSTISASVRSQLRGEALFIRAFCHFYLVNLYGDVPLVVDTDYMINKAAKRSQVSVVYEKIIEDLTQSKKLLAADYAVENGQRIRPNAMAAAALLSRVYLYQQDWEKAAAQATEVISAQSLYRLVGIDSIFLKNNQESIWQLMPVSPVLNTYEGNTFVLIAAPNNVVLSNPMVAVLKGQDKRSAWLGSYMDGSTTYYFPYKYKVRYGTPVLEYSVVLRLGEQYLIRSEAYAHLQQPDKAVSDLDKIRQRAGLTSLSGGAPVTGQALLDSIEKERRVELFSEWGHRWLDLKRTGRAKQVLTQIKGVNFTDPAQLYPIPDSEVQLNPALIQNPGYE